ncbi:MAG: glycoside hydrolase family 13 protein [Streptomycetaceae bacterium]|nr:glycoside hydrolase family 13 protein [Streptomycetaceae bacterium]
MTLPWWRDAVIYQVYLRSFADGDGDGIGDLAGLRSRLDYLVELGVDGIRLSPCYPSPQHDHGYDIADHTGIDPDYGDFEEFDDLLAKAHARGLKVVMDLVPNHCSSRHPWFQEALAAGPGSVERERFLFRDGRGADGSLPPNNWRTQFGDPAWTRVTEPDGCSGQWYLHMFDAGQPDFNWRHPDVSTMFDGILRFWFDRGIDGFHVSTAHGLYKHSSLPDWNGDFFNSYAWNQPEVHEIYRHWRCIIDEYRPERELALVGDLSVPTMIDLASYLRQDELPQGCYGDLLEQPWNPDQFRFSIDRAFAGISPTGATITWVLANHDVHRAVTRYGIIRHQGYHGSLDPVIGLIRPRGPVDVSLGERRARAAALLLFALPGSQYVYQGEELGLPEVLDIPDEARQDPAWFRSGALDPGRDGCRVPLPWSGKEADYGFSHGKSAFSPWLPQPEWFAKYTVEEQWEEETSTLSLYRNALRQRRKVFRPENDRITWLDVEGRHDVLAFRRGDVVCVVLFGDAPLFLPREWGSVMLTSVPMTRDRWLPNNSAAWLWTHTPSRSTSATRFREGWNARRQ